MATSDPFELLGTIVDGRYRIDAVAGRGGYSVVYRAFHLSFESSIALKVLKLPQGLTVDRRNHHLGAFQREGKVLFELSLAHPSIVKAFEAGVVVLFDGMVAPYLALEWLDGVSLDVELKYRRKHGLAPMTLPDVLSLLDGPAEGISLAHARGVVHRDIKPGNLFVCRGKTENPVKVLDFGIAKLLDDSMSTTTRLSDTGPVSSFTPMYAAPEQWLRRLGATGTWTDVHAWALVCVELLVGKMPFMGDEAAQFMAACLDPELRPTPRKLGLDVPDAIEAVFSRGLALSPRDRYRDVGEFWRALSEAAAWSRDRAMPVSMAAMSLADDEGPSHAPPELVRRTNPSGVLTTRTTATRSIVPPPRTRSPLPIAMAVSIGGLVGAGMLLAPLVSRVPSPVSGERRPEPSVDVLASTRAPDPPVVPPAPEPDRAPDPAASMQRDPPSVHPKHQEPTAIGSPSRRALPPVAPSAQTDEPRLAVAVPSATPADAGAHTRTATAPDSGTTLEQLLGNEELNHRR
jgi:serine/threonine-protein kinase